MSATRPRSREIPQPRAIVHLFALGIARPASPVHGTSALAIVHPERTFCQMLQTDLSPSSSRRDAADRSVLACERSVCSIWPEPSVEGAADRSVWVFICPHFSRRPSRSLGRHLKTSTFFAQSPRRPRRTDLSETSSRTAGFQNRRVRDRSFSLGV